MPFTKLAVNFTLTIILVIPILVASPSFGSSIHVKAKISPLLSLSYAEIIGVVGGVVMQNDKAYIKATQNKMASSALIDFKTCR
jgi:hypothetical protein